MTEGQRRLMHARNKVKSFMLNPVEELLAATAALVADEQARREAAEAVLETLRPVWAQGWTSDSEAAQASSSALAGLWERLGVVDQTGAMQRLNDLLELEREHDHA